MSKQDLAQALSDLETALSIISDNVLMPVSGAIYPFYKDTSRAMGRYRKALDDLHEHPYKPESETPEGYEPTDCYCNATSHPPCNFCTREIPA